MAECGDGRMWLHVGGCLCALLDACRRHLQLESGAQRMLINYRCRWAGGLVSLDVGLTYEGQTGLLVTQLAPVGRVQRIDDDGGLLSITVTVLMKCLSLAPVKLILLYKQPGKSHICIDFNKQNLKYGT